MREAVQRGSGRPGRLLILYVGTGHAFQGRGCYAVKMSVRQVKETPGVKNPFKGNSKTKAERGTDTNKLAILGPSRYQNRLHPRLHSGVPSSLPGRG